MDHRAFLDDLLELVVVPSFSAVGPRVRRPLWAWTDPSPGSLEGRTALVTGATGGLGRAASRALADLGARVLLLGRDRGRLEQLRLELAGPGDAGRFAVHVADMADLASVRAAGRAIAASEAALDIVVDNAGMIYPDRTAAADGTEATMALMVVGPFVLVSSLLPLLRRSTDARVVAVTSGGMYASPLDVRDLDGSRLEYSGPRFYARAKRAQVAVIREWARRTRGSAVTFVSMHPGWARTPGLAASLPGFERIMSPILRSPEEGIDTITWLVTAPRTQLQAGRVYLDRRPRPFDRVPWTRLGAAERRMLWDEVVRRTRDADPAPD
ncbi:MAG TPA: SDR family NAD(P)-dependent oxidoreductase [Candidatus Limnocylindrales bacterium]|nr:SDR family NAD(P)-dependent oxidoreductase [Candidatus Limnocylindrales bacterium]